MSPSLTHSLVASLLLCAAAGIPTLACTPEPFECEVCDGDDDDDDGDGDGGDGDGDGGDGDGSGGDGDGDLSELGGAGGRGTENWGGMGGADGTGGKMHVSGATGGVGDDPTPSCSASRLLCDGACVDPLTDNSYCGASAGCMGAQTGALCKDGFACEGGACILQCDDGEVVCDGKCINPLSDRLYCGAVQACDTDATNGVVCQKDAPCWDGACREWEGMKIVFPEEVGVSSVAARALSMNADGQALLLHDAFEAQSQSRTIASANFSPSTGWEFGEVFTLSSASSQTQVGLDATGKAFAIWNDQEAVNLESDVLAVTRAAGVVGWPARATSLDPEPAGQLPGSSTQLAVSPDGRAVSQWVAWDGLWASVFDSVNDQWLPGESIQASGTIEARGLAVYGDTALSTWISVTTAAEPVSAVEARVHDGTNWLAPRALNTRSDIDLADRVDAFFDAAGNGRITWAQRNLDGDWSVWQSEYLVATNLFQPAEKIADDPSIDPDAPTWQKITATSDGTTLLVGAGTTGETNQAGDLVQTIWTKSIQADGSAGSSLVVPLEDALTPIDDLKVMANSAQQILLAWRQNDHMYTSHFDTDTLSWTPAFDLSGQSDGSIFTVFADMDSSGRSFVFWSDGGVLKYNRFE